MLGYYEMVKALKHEKESEVLRLLNQIATDMIRKEDVDRIVKDAVDDLNAKWQKRFDDFQDETEANYKKQMEAMAAENETKIAEIQNQKDGKGNCFRANLQRRDENCNFSFRSGQGQVETE